MGEGTLAEVLDGSATWTIIHADCLDVLPTLADGSVDAVVTDPPYGVGFRGEAWDDSIPDWLPGARRVSPVVMFTTGTLTMWDYPRPDWVMCWSRPASNSHSALGGFSWWSPVMLYGRCKFPIDWISLHAIKHSTAKNVEHPTPKPLALMEWIVGNGPEGLILDPFCGSGTTGVAALRLGRRFIGIEREEQWAELSRERLRAEQNQTTLQAARAGQLAIFGSNE